ncbi:hypothetical protein [Mycetocola zhujimingii]|uniref:Uncharacterized protein n=1 Tax=Mycetocola zhujimingii TaxID=2079792 RepID=A0A2U1TEH7_9MICO|nr:hypothetical protein [Mycetocola zhujimingii]AWB85935.1 hypothetical protein C3E77_04440 [Mycetocola zhujimingii]PWC07292.1 hypothetical protein DF223_06595 [Mycetocola zhujimingii]
MSTETRGRLKILGLSSVTLAVVGSLAGWSAMRSVADAGVYITANIILLTVGAVALYVGFRRADR